MTWRGTCPQCLPVNLNAFMRWHLRHVWGHIKKKKDIQTFSIVLSSTIYSFLGLSVSMFDFCCSLASNPVLVRKQCLAKWPHTSYTFMSVCTADRLSVAHFPTHSYKHTSGACDHHMLGLGILHWILMSLLQFSQEWRYLINQIVEDRLLPQVRGIHSSFFFFLTRPFSCLA